MPGKHTIIAARENGVKLGVVKGLALAITAAGLAVAPVAHAGQVVAGFSSNTLQVCDDCYTNSAVPLGFSANYFGTAYGGTYVSNNGYVTFGSGQGAFTPVGLGAGYAGLPIIAPFYGDVDTRGIGVTRYGTGQFEGRDAFGVTWNNVGYFSSRTDKTNTFQLLLVDRAETGSGNFDIYFNYDTITWETGSASGGTNGLGGISASAGFNAGQGGAPGTYYQLPGSLVNGALLNGGPNALVSNSNVGLPGRFIFTVRNGLVSEVPEPASWAMMIAGFALVGAVMRRNTQQARQKIRVAYS